MTQPKTQQIKELKQRKLQLEIKKDSAQIELDRIDLQIKVIEVEVIKKNPATMPYKTERIKEYQKKIDYLKLQKIEVSNRLNTISSSLVKKVKSERPIVAYFLIS